MVLLKGVGLCTGAAGGIGRAISLQFAKCGCRAVTIADIKSDGLRQTEEMIKKISPSTSVHKLSCDLTSDDAPEQLISSTVNKFSRIDYLVNCAGIPGGVFTSTDTPLDVFDAVQRLNSRTTWQIQRLGIKQMLQQQIVDRQRGSIVNVASMVSHVGGQALSAYTTSKHAVLGMTRADAVDYSKEGVRINCVAPGLIQTEFGADIPEEIASAFLTPLVQRTPMGRTGQAEEVATCVAFLCSPLASYVTGASLAVDGGFTAA